MPTEIKNRVIYILKYLWDNTDENHPAVINDINAYLESIGIAAGRKTISNDIMQLQECGYDVICNKSRQNQYFIGSRDLDLAELVVLYNRGGKSSVDSPYVAVMRQQVIFLLRNMDGCLMTFAFDRFQKRIAPNQVLELICPNPDKILIQHLSKRLNITVIKEMYDAANIMCKAQRPASNRWKSSVA